MESKQVSHSGIRREWNGGLFKEDFGHRVETQQLIFPESHEWGGGMGGCVGVRAHLRTHWPMDISPFHR